MMLNSRILSLGIIMGSVLGNIITAFNTLINRGALKLALQTLPSKLRTPLMSVLVDTFLISLSHAVKVPQILKCVRARSVENLSYIATFLELAAATFTSAYNYNKGFAFR